MPKIRSKATIRFIEFVRPDCYWPAPYTIEQAFHVYQWMVRTGRDYSEWGRSGVYDLLCCKGTCVSHSAPDAILSTDDLRQRFHCALLSAYASKLAQQWREAEKVVVAGERILMFPHYAPFEGAGRWRCEADIQSGLDGWFEAGRTRRTAGSLNQYHPTARTCKSVHIEVSADRFYFNLEYGWPDSECTSHWFYPLAQTVPGEPFTDGLGRAIDALDALTEKTAAAA
jgi:hypothetical protein